MRTVLMAEFLPWLISAACIALPYVARAQSAAQRFPALRRSTGPEEDLSGRMMDGAHRFVERKIAEAIQKRHQAVGTELQPGMSFKTTKQTPNCCDEPSEPLIRCWLTVAPTCFLKMERFGDDAWPAFVAETPAYKVYQVRWPAVETVEGEGLLVQPAVSGGPCRCGSGCGSNSGTTHGPRSRVARGATMGAPAGGEWIRDCDSHTGHPRAPRDHRSAIDSFAAVGTRMDLPPGLSHGAARYRI